MEFFVVFIALVFATEHSEESNGQLFEQNAYAPILVKIEEDEYFKVKKTKTSKYIGVSYSYKHKNWMAARWSKSEKRAVTNGSYKDEETAAHASDTLARKLMANGEQNHTLNFPDDDTRVYPEEKNWKKYTGVSYYAKTGKWRAFRWSQKKNNNVHSGYYKHEETAARASDTVARKLMANGEQGHKLNFPDDNTEVYKENKNSSKYKGVSYNKTKAKWQAFRWSQKKNKNVHSGYYKDEETAARASDTLVRKLRENGEQNHKLNFPDDEIEGYPEENWKNKRKRPDTSQADEKVSEKFEGKKQDRNFSNQLAV